jgi:hypothetical protein
MRLFDTKTVINSVLRLINPRASCESRPAVDIRSAAMACPEGQAQLRNSDGPWYTACTHVDWADAQRVSASSRGRLGYG